MRRVDYVCVRANSRFETKAIKGAMKCKTKNKFQ